MKNKKRKRENVENGTRDGRSTFVVFMCTVSQRVRYYSAQSFRMEREIFCSKMTCRIFFLFFIFAQTTLSSSFSDIFYSARWWVCWVAWLWYFSLDVRCGCQCATTHSAVCSVGRECMEWVNMCACIKDETDLCTEQSIPNGERYIRWMSSGLSCDGYKREIYYYVALVQYCHVLYTFRCRRRRRL